MTNKGAAISPIYERGLLKRSHGITARKTASLRTDDSTPATRLNVLATKYDTREIELNLVRNLKRSESICIKDLPEDKLRLNYNAFGRAVAALNKVRAFGEFYILPLRGERDTSNKFTIKKSSRQIKSYVKEGPLLGFTVTRL